MKNRNNLTDTFVLQEYLRKILVQPTVEEIHVLYMDANGWLLLDEMHSRGTFDTSNVYPEQIARNALNCKARKIILAHNHPSQSVYPSDNDLKMTMKLNEITKQLDIVLYDHIIVTRDSYFSMKETNIL